MLRGKFFKASASAGFNRSASVDVSESHAAKTICCFEKIPPKCHKSGRQAAAGDNNGTSLSVCLILGRLP